MAYHQAESIIYRCPFQWKTHHGSIACEFQKQIAKNIEIVVPQKHH